MRHIFIGTILFFLCEHLQAQQAFTNKGNIKIHSGASMTSFGNFTNSSSASFVNNGSFYSKADLTNDQASMTAGTGTLYFNGTSAQTVSGSQIFKALDLVSNNSS